MRGETTWVKIEAKQLGGKTTWGGGGNVLGRIVSLSSHPLETVQNIQNKFLVCRLIFYVIILYVYTIRAYKPSLWIVKLCAIWIITLLHCSTTFLFSSNELSQDLPNVIWSGRLDHFPLSNFFLRGYAKIVKYALVECFCSDDLLHLQPMIFPKCKYFESFCGLFTLSGVYVIPDRLNSTL